MPDLADRYRSLAALFTERVAAVPADDPRWEDPSPCEGWAARDVVQHMLDTHSTFFGLIGHEAPPFPAVADGPLPAWTAARDAMQAALDDPVVAGTEFEGMFGRTRWDAAVDRFITSDVLVHTWDLSRALGLDDRLPPAEVAIVHQRLEGLPEEAMRSPGTFGAAVEPPAGADAQDRLLAFLGRDPGS